MTRYDTFPLIRVVTAVGKITTVCDVLYFADFVRAHSTNTWLGIGEEFFFFFFCKCAFARESVFNRPELTLCSRHEGGGWRVEGGGGIP